LEKTKIVRREVWRKVREHPYKRNQAKNIYFAI